MTGLTGLGLMFMRKRLRLLSRGRHALACRELVSSLIGGVWTFFKAHRLRKEAKEDRLDQALLTLEAAVDRVYETYVRSIKEASEDGKLTKEERKRARELARETAIEFGQDEGIDVIRALGEDYLDLWINKLVRRLKVA
jgi:hypothetical protein